MRKKQERAVLDASKRTVDTILVHLSGIGCGVSVHVVQPFIIWFRTVVSLHICAVTIISAPDNTVCYSHYCPLPSIDGAAIRHSNERKQGFSSVLPSSGNLVELSIFPRRAFSSGI